MNSEGVSMTVLFNTRRVRQPKASDYVRGASSILNIRGNTKREYDLAPTAIEADKAAIDNDWRAVSADLNEAIETYRRNAS